MSEHGRNIPKNLKRASSFVGRGICRIHITSFQLESLFLSTSTSVDRNSGYFLYIVYNTCTVYTVVQWWGLFKKAFLKAVFYLQILNFLISFDNIVSPPIGPTTM